MEVSLAVVYETNACEGGLFLKRLSRSKHYRDADADAEGLKTRLAHQLSPQAASLITEWVIGDCVATYWRPHFEPQLYPYLPVHVTRPKEIRKLFAVHLPERCYFAVGSSSALTFSSESRQELQTAR